MNQPVNVPSSLIKTPPHAELELRTILHISHELTQFQLKVLMAIADLETIAPGEDTETKRVLREVRRYLQSAAVTVEPVRQYAFEKTFDDIPY